MEELQNDFLKNVKKVMMGFFMGRNILHEITNIDCKLTVEDEIITGALITIHCHQPKYFIGVEGRIVKALAAEFKNKLQLYNVGVQVEDCGIWNLKRK